MSEKKCAKCGADAKEIIKDGNVIGYKCSTNVWNKDTKTASGCDWVEWNNQNVSSWQPLPDDVVCPKCGSKCKTKIAKNGTKKIKCSLATWNAATKEWDNCDYYEDYSARFPDEK